MAGKDRSTLYRHMEKGKLSRVEGLDGSPVIDTAELMRVYGALQVPQSQDGAAPVAKQHSATPLRDTEKQARREARAALEASRRREVELLEAQVVDLRERVAAVETERDTWRDTYQAEAASPSRHPRRDAASHGPARGGGRGVLTSGLVGAVAGSVARLTRRPRRGRQHRPDRPRAASVRTWRLRQGGRISNDPSTAFRRGEERQPEIETPARRGACGGTSETQCLAA